MSLPLALIASLVVTTAPHSFPQSLTIVDNAARLDLGCKQMQSKHFAEAAATFSRLLNASPDEAMAFFRRGQCYYCMHKYADAINDFNAAIDSEPELSVFYLWRGTAHAKCSNDEAAIADYQRAMELDPVLVHLTKQSKISVDVVKPGSNAASPNTFSPARTEQSTASAPSDAPREKNADSSKFFSESSNEKTASDSFASEVRGIVAKETARIEGDSRAGLDPTNSTTVDLGYNERAVEDYREALRRMIEKRKVRRSVQQCYGYHCVFTRSLQLLMSALLLSVSLADHPCTADNTTSNMSTIHSWKDLKEAAATSSPDVHYFEFSLENGSKAHLVVVDLKSHKVRIRPYVNTSGRPTSETCAEINAIAAVNGGYFNLSNGLSASYIILNGKVACDPHHNPALMHNEKLLPFMDKILDRTELRFVRGKDGKSSVQIARHSAPCPSDASIVDSLQAGPQLLPELSDRSEAFVRTESDGKEVDSIGVHRTAARTAFGITDDNHALILCVAGNKQDEFSAGATLSDVAETLKKLGCSRAINFDGGTSTTMVVSLKAGDGQAVRTMVCGRQPETHVKSLIAVENNHPVTAR